MTKHLSKLLVAAAAMFLAASAFAREWNSPQVRRVEPWIRAGRPGSRPAIPLNSIP